MNVSRSVNDNEEKSIEDGLDLFGFQPKEVLRHFVEQYGSLEIPLER
jgi:hypothetical protein